MKTHIPKQRLLAAIVFAPWIVPLVLFLQASEEDRKGFMLFVIFGVPFAYLGVLAIGIPAMLILDRFDFLRLWSLALCGLIGGIAVNVFFYFFLHWISLGPLFDWLFIVRGAEIGLVTALAFGLIAEIRMK